MQFRTQIKIPESDFKITHQDKILMLGSCFSKNIGERLVNLKFNTLINPYGILFNPISVYNSLNEIIDNKKYTQNDLGFHDGLYYSFNHHGRFKNSDIDITLKNINTEIQEAYNQLQNLDYLVITFGTSWAYQYKKARRIVANCHKIPNYEFEKIFISKEEIINSFNNTYSKLKSIVPNLKILFTISPVRHWKDGVTQNQISKGNLFLTINEMILNNSNCYYFPAYEIVMDELRDYRFYKEDMLHPNKLAIDYIWDKFSEVYFSEETKNINSNFNKLNKLAFHRSITR